MERFAERVCARGAAARDGRERLRPRRRTDRASMGSRSSRASAAGEAEALVSPDSATCDDCLRGALRPRRPPLPLSVHQLHQLRPALHDRARRSLRPAAHDDGGVRDVRALPRPSTTTPPTGASTPSRTPAPTAGRSCAGRSAAGEALRAAVAALARRRGSSPSRAWAAITSPAGADDERAVGDAARAQAPRGQAVRADGTRPRCGTRAGRAHARRTTHLLTGRERPIVIAAAPRRARRSRNRWRPLARSRRDAAVLAAAPPAARGRWARRW